MAGTSHSHGSAFTAAELEFLAEDESIEIVPNMRMDLLNFTSGDFGPFRPQIPTQVPLWLAVALKKRGKCTIKAPEWMSGAATERKINLPGADGPMLTLSIYA